MYVWMVLTQAQLSDMVQVSDLGSDCYEERAVGRRVWWSLGGISPFSYVQPMPAEHENAPGIQLTTGQNTPDLNRSQAGLDVSLASGLVTQASACARKQVWISVCKSIRGRWGMDLQSESREDQGQFIVWAGKLSDCRCAHLLYHTSLFWQEHQSESCSAIVQVLGYCRVLSSVHPLGI